MVKVRVMVKNWSNKKVLLRERKRHTARRVVSTPSVVLTGYPPPPSRVPPPVLTWWGVPYLGTAGYPPGRVRPPAGYPPPPPVSAPWHFGKCCRQIDGWKDRRVSKHYLPVVLRTRAVINIWCSNFPFKNFMRGRVDLIPPFPCAWK